jgi:hypothetical protein
VGALVCHRHWFTDECRFLQPLMTRSMSQTQQRTVGLKDQS